MRFGKNIILYDKHKIIKSNICRISFELIEIMLNKQHDSFYLNKIPLRARKPKAARLWFLAVRVLRETGAPSIVKRRVGSG